MAYEGYITIKGQKQGQFKGAAPSSRRGKEWIPIVAFSMGVRAPYDLGDGRPKGARQHSPITVTKRSDSASPQFMQALMSKEVLSEATIELHDPGRLGVDPLIKRITMTGGVITSIRSRPPTNNRLRPPTNNAASALTDISFSFQKIAVEEPSQSTTTSDDWSTC